MVEQHQIHDNLYHRSDCLCCAMGRTGSDRVKPPRTDERSATTAVISYNKHSDISSGSYSPNLLHAQISSCNYWFP